MSNADKYKRELDSIQASDDFKYRTEELLQKAAEAPAPVPDTQKKSNVRFFTPRRVVAAACALLVLTGSVAFFRSGMFSMNSAAEAASAPTSLAGADAEEIPLAPHAAEQSGGAIDSFSSFPASSYFTRQTATPQTPASPIDFAAEAPLILDEAPLVLADIEAYAADWPAHGSLPASLPVYTGLDAGEEEDPAALKALIEEQAAALGLSVDHFDEPAQDASLTGHGTGWQMTALKDGSVQISYLQAVEPAAGPAPAADAPLARHEEYLWDIMAEHVPLLAGMQAPTLRLAATCSDAGQPLWHYQIYDAGTTPADQLLGRSLTHATFFFNEEGWLSGIGLSRADTSAPLGEYALRSEEAAREELAAGGGFAAAFAGAFPGEGAIAKTDIVYLPTDDGAYLLPYYKFYTLLPDSALLTAAQQSENAGAYACWYVCAVEGAAL